MLALLGTDGQKIERVLAAKGLGVPARGGGERREQRPERQRSSEGFSPEPRPMSVEIERTAARDADGDHGIDDHAEGVDCRAGNVKR